MESTIGVEMAECGDWLHPSIILGEDEDECIYVMKQMAKISNSGC